jgi:hypothetical protein
MRSTSARPRNTGDSLSDLVERSGEDLEWDLEEILILFVQPEQVTSRFVHQGDEHVQIRIRIRANDPLEFGRLPAPRFLLPAARIPGTANVPRLT